MYFTTSRQPTPGECVGLVDEVGRVPVRGGPVAVVGPGVFPAVSPDGKFLAYVRNASNPCDSDHDQLVVLDLESGARRSYVSSCRVDLEFLAWATDSVHLAYNDDAEPPYTSPMLINTATAGTLDDATPIPHATNADWAGFLGDGGALGVTPHNGSHANPATVVDLEPATGVATRTLFTIPGGLAVANVFDGPEDTLHADRSGKNVLAIGLLPADAQIRHGALYRWHEGDRKATLVADQIRAAEWIEPANVPSATSP